LKEKLIVNNLLDYSEIKEVKITIEYTDVIGNRGSNNFKIVQEHPKSQQ
jgi:hypothetical protein